MVIGFYHTPHSAEAITRLSVKLESWQ